MWYSIGCLAVVGAAVDGITAAATTKNDTTDRVAKSFLFGMIVTLFRLVLLLSMIIYVETETVTSHYDQQSVLSTTR